MLWDEVDSPSLPGHRDIGHQSKLAHGGVWVLSQLEDLPCSDPSLFPRVGRMYPLVWAKGGGYWLYFAHINICISPIHCSLAVASGRVCVRGEKSWAKSLGTGVSDFVSWECSLLGDWNGSVLTGKSLTQGDCDDSAFPQPGLELWSLGMCWPPHLRLMCLDMFFVCECEFLHVVGGCIVHCSGPAFSLACRPRRMWLLLKLLLPNILNWLP